MKMLLVLPAAFVVVAAHAGEAALPEFNSKTLSLPPLSLGAIARPPSAARGFASQLVEPRLAIKREAAPERRVTRDAGMPILAPDPKIDYKMIVQAPDPAVDFKMVVQSPAAETRK